MNPSLQAHAYVLTRFARLSAPASALNFEMRLLAEAFDEMGGSWQTVAPEIDRLLREYERKKRPLIEQAWLLLPVVVPATKHDLARDPCHLAQRARNDGWPVEDEAKLEEMLELAAACDALDRELVARLQQLLHP